MQNGFYDEDERFGGPFEGDNTNSSRRSVFSPDTDHSARISPKSASHNKSDFSQRKTKKYSDEYASGSYSSSGSSHGGSDSYSFGVGGTSGGQQKDDMYLDFDEPSSYDSGGYYEPENDSGGRGFRKRREDMTESELERHEKIFGQYEEADGWRGRLYAFVFNNNKLNLLVKFLIMTIFGTYILSGFFQYFELPLLGVVQEETMDHTWLPIKLLIGMLNFHPILLLVAFLASAIFAMTICIMNWKYMHDKMQDFDYSNRTSKGSAHFATDEEISDGAVDFEPRRKPQGIVLGINEDQDPAVAVSVTKDLGSNQNVAVYGPAGTGKSRNFVRPNILTCIDNKTSFIVTDPAGELFRDTAKLANEKGMRVRVLNFNKLDASNGWDCFAEIKKLWAEGKTLEAETMIDILVTTIIDNTEDDFKKSDPYYPAIESNLLTFLVKYVAVSPYFAGEDYERHLGTCYDILVELMGGNGQLPIFESVKGRLDEPSRTNWVIFSGYGQKQKESAMSGLEGKIRILNNMMVKEVFAHDEIDLQLPGKEPCAYYVISPITTSQYRFLLSLFFSCMFQTLISEAEENQGSLSIPVRFLLDEFKAIGQINDFENKISNVRKYGISLSIIFQDPSQIENNYPDLSNSILANCATHLIMGVNDNETAETVSDRAGTATIEDRTIRYSKPRFNPIFIHMQEQETAMESERLLITPDEVMRMRDTFGGKYLVAANGKNIYPVTPYTFDNHYLADYINKPENKWDPRAYIPAWQNEEKAMDREHTFRGMSERAGGGFGGGYGGGYGANRGYGQQGVRKPTFDPNGEQKAPEEVKEDDVIKDSTSKGIPGANQRVVTRPKKKRNFVPETDDTGNCISMDDLEAPEKGDTANRLTMEMLDDIDLL